MAESVAVIVAAGPEPAALWECLESLAGQRDAETEVFVVSNGPPSPGVRERFPWTVWLEEPRARLAPQLWGAGARRTRSEIVAFTTHHFSPAPDWLALVRKTHLRLASAAIGGRIDPPRGLGPVAWAAYFLRYSAYLCYDRERCVFDLAGDNASYKRTALVSHPESVVDGFWEQELHRHLIQEGKTLSFVPELRVTQRASFGFLPFLRQRFAHGRRFGQARWRGWGRVLRMAAVFAAPLIPVVFLAKIVGRVARSGRDLLPFATSLPALLCFLLAWSLGEACGYLLPDGDGGGIRGEASRPD